VLNPIIETAIGLIFVYLLLSMVCSSIQEFLAALFGWRAKTLREGIENMLGDEKFVDSLYNDPLIRSLGRLTWWDKLTRKKIPRPSYIPADLFAKALLNAANIQVTDPAAKPNLSESLSNSPNVKKVLQSLANFAPDFNTLLTNIEAWYNSGMDRVSGWYKRKTQKVILLIAAALAGVLNADTLMLATAFWHDPVLRAAAVSAATDYVKTHQSQTGQSTTTAQDKAEMFPSTTPPGTADIPPREETVEQASKNLSDTLTDMQAQLTKINLPLGWNCELCTDAEKKKNAEQAQKSQAGPGEKAKEPNSGADNASQQAGGKTEPCKSDVKKTIEAKAKCVRGQVPQDGWDILVKIFGLLLTILALSQGSPFWFDLLQRLVNLRLAGNPPPAKPTTTTTTTTQNT
jgi:hypothetical protein